MHETPILDLLDENPLFRSLAECAPLMLWVTGSDGSCLYVNEAWLAFRGRTRPQELGRGWHDGLHADDRERVIEVQRLALVETAAFTVDFRLQRADGVYRWVRQHGLPWTSDTGGFRGHIGSCADITQERTLESSNGERDQRLTTLIEHAQDIVYRMRVFPALEFEYVGGAVQAITGHTAEEFYRDPYLPRKAVHPDDLQLVTSSFENPDRLRAAVTVRWIHPDGSTVWAEHRRVPVFDSSGRLLAIEGIARDVTARVESQRHQETSEAQLRELAARVQAAREDERTRVARELHDELGQILTTLKLELGRAMAVLRTERLSPIVVDRLQALMGLSEIGVATVKRIATNLRPPTLDHLGISEAIRWEALTFKARTGIRCHVRANKTRTALTSEQQTALFRIFQEALTNIVRHAQASAIYVMLAERGTQFELRIRDNGKGITEAESENPRAIGLVGMRERAALIGGTFKITGRRGKGTTVQVQVPIVRAAGRTTRTRDMESHTR